MSSEIRLHSLLTILESALTAIEKHKSLPAGQAENYASKFAKGTSHFNIQQDERTASLAL